jgi:hypothetical protein
MNDRSRQLPIGDATAKGGSMTEKQQRVCIGIGLIFLPLFWLGLMVAGWFPPPRPDLTASEVQRMFTEDRLASASAY